MDSGKVSDTWSAIDCSRRHLLNGWLSSQVHFWIVLSYCIVQVGAVRKCGRRQFEMRDKYPFGYDERLLGGCLYCGAATDTTEHIPSKVFLDKPYPANLHTMKSCGSCNNGFSIDEEYVSCFIDAVICGSTEDLGILRPKVGETFIRKPEVANRIEASRRTDGDETFWNPEIPRFIRIIEKIARGHASHDLGLRDLGTESGSTPHVGFWPIGLMEDVQVQEFEHPVAIPFWPELGSRAFYQALSTNGKSLTEWTILQKGRYRYLATPVEPSVRMVFSEYLTCIVTWD